MLLHRWPAVGRVHWSPVDSSHRGTVVWNLDVFLHFPVCIVELPVRGNPGTRMCFHCCVKFVFFFSTYVDLKYWNCMINTFRAAGHL